MKTADVLHRVRFPLTLLILIAASCSPRGSLRESEAWASRDTVWNDFRTKYPSQFQMVGLAEYDDHSKLLILSEPSGHVSESGIAKIFADYDFYLTVKQHPIGYDGWVKDLLVVLRDPGDKEFADLLKRLHTYLFHTDYKAYTIPLPVRCRAESFLPCDLNLRVSAAELQKWFLTDGELLSNARHHSSSLGDLFDAPEPEGIYFSEKTGFVVWILDVENDLKDRKVEARKFSLDADLILGAIVRGKHVAIIGREREVPVDLLPPLRVETIMRLAAVKHGELAQSYERGNLLAGRLCDENGMPKDWAPVLLSPELWHTEYGQLLNVTDQMLKSWSENGSVTYDGFASEKPVEWVFDRSAIHDLQVSELTYNWNTEGVGYVVWMDDGDAIYALNRTGSLPVSYIPGAVGSRISREDNVYRAEEKAYDWFSSMNHCDLVRVVQYAALYQIFRNLQIDYVSRAGDESEVERVFEETEGTPQKHEMDSEVLEKAAYEVLSEYAAGGFDEDYPISSELKGICNGYEMEELSDGKNLLQAVAENLANPHKAYRWEYDAGDSERIAEASTALVSASNRFNLFVLHELYRLDVRNEYVRANENNCSVWMKCPSIVQSRSTDLDFVGGHNLNARTTPYLIDKTMEAGFYEVEENVLLGIKMVRIAREDVGRIRSRLLREIERTGVCGRRHFPDEPVEILPRGEVIAARVPRSPARRGFIAEEHLLVKRMPEGVEVAVGDEKLLLHDCEAVKTFLVEQNRSATIVFEDYTVNEVKATITGADIHQTVRLKRTGMPDLRVDYSNPSYEIISDHRIEVTFPYAGKSVSRLKISFRNTPFEKVKNFLNGLGRGKRPYDLYRESGVQPEHVKKAVVLEFESGLISDNHEYESCFDRVDFPAYAA